MLSASSFAAITVVAAVVFFVFKIVQRHLLAVKRLKHIPGVTQFLLPYISIPGIEKHISTSNKQFYKGLYKITKTYAANGVCKYVTYDRPVVLLSDPEHIKHVFVKKSKDYPKPSMRMYNAFDIFGPNILSANGDLWRKHRVLCNHAFNDEHNVWLANITNDTMYDIVTNLWKQDSFELDINESMTKITLQIMGLAGFGVDLQAMQGKSTFDTSRYTMSLREALTIASGEGIIYRLRFPSWVFKLPISSIKRVKEGIENTDRYIDDIINSRISDSEQRYDLLSLLVSARDDDQGQGFTRLEIKSDAFIFLFAGHDTTSSQLSWTSWLLASHPEIQEKIYQEVKSVFGDREKLTFDDYTRLEYTNCVVRESMRLFPPVTHVLKEAAKDDEIGGYHIPQGTLININFYALHHSEKYWKDPEVFRPERFDKQHISEVNQLAYLPFSLGSRKCIGFMFSLTESAFIIAHLIRNFKFELTNKQKETNWEPVPEQMITMKPKELSLQLTRRK
jgi:cytochrome P450